LTLDDPRWALDAMMDAAQLGSRVQHALRAYAPKDQRMVRAEAQAFRENPAVIAPS
jgi:hypothetical protein